MGTWCGDSRREVPRMYKILDYCQVKALTGSAHQFEQQRYGIQTKPHARRTGLEHPSRTYPAHI